MPFDRRMIYLVCKEFVPRTALFFGGIPDSSGIREADFFFFSNLSDFFSPLPCGRLLSLVSHVSKQRIGQISVRRQQDNMTSNWKLLSSEVLNSDRIVCQ